MQNTLFAAFIGLSLTGCGPDGPTMYTVSGKLDLTGGDVGLLAGSTVEIKSDSEPSVRAAGEIRADGRFQLESLHSGVMRRGAMSGSYRVRIVLADDDAAARKRAAKAIDRKYLKFDTSDLTLQVPATDDVVLKLAAR
jgi:hypothetical protein